MSSLQPPGGLSRSTSGRKRHLKRTDKKGANVVSTDTVKEQQVSYIIINGVILQLFECSPSFSAQQRLKEEREAKLSRMDGRHEYLFSTLSYKIDLSSEDIQEYIIPGNQV